MFYLNQADEIYSPEKLGIEYDRIDASDHLKEF
jgi:hypothetical protein